MRVSQRAKQENYFLKIFLRGIFFKPFFYEKDGPALLAADGSGVDTEHLGDLGGSMLRVNELEDTPAFDRQGLNGLQQELQHFRFDELSRQAVVDGLLPLLFCCIAFQQVFLPVFCCKEIDGFVAKS